MAGARQRMREPSAWWSACVAPADGPSDSALDGDCWRGGARREWNNDDDAALDQLYLCPLMVTASWLVVVALGTLVTICANILRLVRYCVTGNDGYASEHRADRRNRLVYPLRIRRRRINRRRNIRDSDEGVRASCRRYEACLCIWLAVSNHVLAAQVLCGRVGKMRNWTDNDFPEMRAHRGAVTGGGQLADNGVTCNVTEATRASQFDRRSPIHARQGVNDWSKASRVGEAKNPGPFAGTVAAHGLLRKVYATATSALAYPRPGRGTLKRTVAPGYGDDRAQQGGETGEFSMAIEAVNATGWRSLQRRLMNTQSQVLLAQETWLTQDAVPAASAWARRNGWQSIWTAAVPGPHGGASGGAAILVKEGIGLRYPPGGSHVWWPGRVVAAMIDAPGHRPLLVASCYLIHGIGPAAANLEILAAIGQRISAMGDEHEFVIGGT